ncbi:hypothetical protein EDD21DRAFT_421954 [Dissophora ornata]|nr:hypothetical protein EDD21DRAFT_421954 [Dissophora ornata]
MKKKVPPLMFVHSISMAVGIVLSSYKTQSAFNTVSKADAIQGHLDETKLRGHYVSIYLQGTALLDRLNVV